MSIKVKDLVKKLKEKDQSKDVEFVVVGTDEMMVCMDVETSAKSMVKLLKMFNK